MEVQNYTENMPKGGLEDLYSGYKQTSEIIALGDAIAQQKLQQIQAKEKQVYVKQLSDIYSNPKFRELPFKDQVNETIGIIGKYDPEQAQKMLLDVSKEEEATKQKTLTSIMTLMGHAVTAKNPELANQLLPVLQELEPGMKVIKSLDISGEKMRSKAVIFDGKSWRTITTDIDPKNGKATPISSEEYKRERVSGTVNGVAMFGFPNPNGEGFLSFETNKEIPGFRPLDTSTIRNRTAGFGPEPKAKPGVSVYANRVSNLSTSIRNDKTLSKYSTQIDALRNITELNKIDSNSAATAQVYSFAKLLDPSGRISDKDITVLAAGNTDVYSAIERFKSKYTWKKGKALSDADRTAIVEVANAIEKGLQEKRNRTLQSMEQNELLLADKFGKDFNPLITDIYSTFKKEYGSTSEATSVETGKTISTGVSIINYDPKDDTLIFIDPNSNEERKISYTKAIEMKMNINNMDEVKAIRTKVIRAKGGKR